MQVFDDKDDSVYIGRMTLDKIQEHEKAKLDKLIAVVNSFEASARAAMDGLESGNFDLWVKMYGFVVSGL